MGQIKKLLIDLFNQDEAIILLIIDRKKIAKGLMSYRFNQHILFF